MRTACATAEGLLDAVVNVKPIPDLEKTVLDNEAAVRQNQESIIRSLPDFAPLVRQVAAAPATIAPADYIDRDMSSRKAQLLNEFRQLQERVGVVEAAAGAAAGVVAGGANVVAAPPPPASAAAERLKKYTPRLLEYVRTETPRSLQRAETFLLEMKEDIYAERLEEQATKQPPALRVVTVPATAETNQPVLFRVCFAMEALNDAAACREWNCTWDFGDKTPEESGWRAFHEFLAAGAYTVTVNIFCLQTGERIVSFPGMRISVMDSGQPNASDSRWKRLVRWFSPESKLEASRLLLVLAAAVIGLIGVAQQRVDSLTLLQSAFAVIALGFGADTLKNLLSQK
jgi:hypothetical protein